MAQYGAQVRMLHSDNRKEYMNTKFGKYLSNHGILYQTTCRDRAPQNGIAEKMS